MQHQMCTVCNGTDTESSQQWPRHRFGKAGNGRGQIHPDTPQEPVSGTIFSQRHKVLPLPAHIKVSATQVKKNVVVLRELDENVSFHM
jgi:hypothetical protein